MSMFGPQNRTSIEVFHNAMPPADDGDPAAFNYFPINVAATQNVDTLNAIVPLAGVQTALFLWVARRMRLPNGTGTKPNPIRPAIMHSSGVECRMEFSTAERAMAATRIHAAYGRGATLSECHAIAAMAGMTAADVIPYEDAVANKETLFAAAPDPAATPPYTAIDYRVSRDKVVLANARFLDGAGTKWGIVLDYEAQDQRTEAQSLSLIQQVATDYHAHGLKVYLYTNPYDGPVAPTNGISAVNLPEIVSAVDRVSMLLGADIAPNIIGSFRAQMRALSGGDRNLTPDQGKLSITIAPSGDRHAALQAGYVFRRLLTDWSRIRSLWVWPNLTPMGGDGDTQANRVIGAAALGLGMPAPITRRG